MAYIKEERYDKETTEAIAAHYKEILRLLGEDPEREGLVKTPERVARHCSSLPMDLSRTVQKSYAARCSRRNISRWSW